MLLQFSLGNYRSFRERQKLSLVASGDHTHDGHVFDTGYAGLRALKSVALFGANASGKSNLIQGLALMEQLVRSSAKDSQRDEPLPVEPFALDAVTAGAPTEFEVVIVVDGECYTYGFTADRERVHEEWLSVSRKLAARTGTRELYSRSGDEIRFGSGWRGERQHLAGMTRSNGLLLSTAAMLNSAAVTPVFSWFAKRLWFASEGVLGAVGLSRCFERFKTDEAFRVALARTLQHADVGISDVDYLDEPFDEERLKNELGRMLLPEAIGPVVQHVRQLPDGPARRKPVTKHRRTDGSIVAFDAMRQESEGTKKLILLSALWYDMLHQNQVLALDEIETRLHPALVDRLLAEVHLAAGSQQLIFTTHDAGLMDTAALRRDQVWFTEKDEGGATHLSSRWDFRARKDVSGARAYLQGRYGAVPVIGELGLGRS